MGEPTPEQLEMRSFGVWLKAGGTQTVCATLMLVLAAVVMLALYMHDQKAAVRAEVIVKGAATVASNQEHFEHALEEMIYVLSLSPEERARMKLAMPPSLRDRILKQERTP